MNKVHILESKIFAADVKELDNLFEYSTRLLRILEFSNRDITMINTALEEVFVNVAKYAYDDSGTVEVSLTNDKKKVIFVFKDSGKPFNPLELENPDITLDASERQIGGLGIFIVKQSMDEISYEYKNNQNVFKMTKKIK